MDANLSDCDPVFHVMVHLVGIELVHRRAQDMLKIDFNSGYANDWERRLTAG